MKDVVSIKYIIIIHHSVMSYQMPHNSLYSTIISRFFFDQALVCPEDQSATIYGNRTSMNISLPMPHLLNGSTVDIDIMCSANSLTEFPPGRTNVTCNATDGADLFDTCDFNVFIYCKYKWPTFCALV